MSNPRYWWHGFVREMISRYPFGLDEGTPMGLLAREAIKEALEETEQLPDGKDRVAVARMVCIMKSHTFEGAADVLHTSPRNVQRYVKHFTYLVATKIGFI